MENTNLSNLINILSHSTSSENVATQDIPKEVLDQYPYGDFPLRYTKVGQEYLRKNSEARYLNPTLAHQESKKLDPDMSTLVSLLSLVGNKKKNPNDMLELFSSLLFKDNPEIKNLLKLFGSKKQPEVNSCNTFPSADSVKISSLKRVE